MTQSAATQKAKTGEVYIGLCGQCFALILEQKEVVTTLHLQDMHDLHQEETHASVKKSAP